MLIRPLRFALLISLIYLIFSSLYIWFSSSIAAESSSTIFELKNINPPKCSEFDYINFLIASSRVFSCTEASKCSSSDPNDSAAPSHDSFTRLLLRQPPDTEALWEEV